MAWPQSRNHPALVALASGCSSAIRVLVADPISPLLAISLVLPRKWEGGFRSRCDYYARPCFRAHTAAPANSRVPRRLTQGVLGVAPSRGMSEPMQCPSQRRLRPLRVLAIQRLQIRQGRSTFVTSVVTKDERWTITCRRPT